MTSKSEKTDIRRQVLVNNEERHSISNVPMSIPKGAFQLVPGIFVASKESLPRLIEFFNVTHIVRCVETDAQEAKEDWLITLGGNQQEPYGSAIKYPKNVFHCPLRDSIDETEFIPWAKKASEFISNTLHIEEDEEIVLATNQAKEEAARDAEEAEAKKKQEEYLKVKYKDDRRSAYPDIGDQLDDLYKQGAFSDEMAAKIKKVKDDNPKPS